MSLGEKESVLRSSHAPEKQFKTAFRFPWKVIYFHQKYVSETFKVKMETKIQPALLGHG